MILFLITIYCLLFAFLAWKNLPLSLYLLMAFLPSYLIRFTILGLPATLLEAMIVIIVTTALIRKKIKWREIKANPFFWPTVFILIFASLSIWQSAETIKALGVWKAYFVEPILLFIIAVEIIKTKEQIKHIFWALGISATYLSIIAIWQNFSGWNVPEAYLINGAVDRVVSIFSYPNALGLYLGPIIILMTGFLFWSQDNWLKQLIKIIIISLSFSAIVLAQSEGALLAIIVVWWLWLLVYKKTRLPAILLALGAILIFFTNPSVNQFIIEKVLLQDYSGLVRRLIWGETWQMLKDNWFWGAGLSGYQTAIKPYHLPTFEIFMYPHNILLNFWSEVGLMGLISFIWLAVIFVWQNIKTYFFANRATKILALTLMATALQMAIHGLVDVPYFKNDLSVLCWIIVAMSVIIIKAKKPLNIDS